LRLKDPVAARPHRLPSEQPRQRGRAAALNSLEVLETGRWHTPLCGRPGARFIAVRGRAGAGTSSVAANLAIAMAGLRSRVVLLDLLGHGRSDKPLQASAYRMDSYADEVVALLDHLQIDRAAIGGVSLGADVSLQVAVRAPERVAGLLHECDEVLAAFVDESYRAAAGGER